MAFSAFQRSVLRRTGGLCRTVEIILYSVEFSWFDVGDHRFFAVARVNGDEFCIFAHDFLQQGRIVALAVLVGKDRPRPDVEVAIKMSISGGDSLLKSGLCCSMVQA